jgi:peptide methionine sulfoxide reductase msrA/msrB
MVQFELRSVLRACAVLGLAGSFACCTPASESPAAAQTQPLSTMASSEPSASVDKSELRSRLTPLQYRVTQQCGTEPAFTGAYWDNHEPGIYVDVVDATPLFSSIDKFDSGSGWPSFTKPLADESVKELADDTHGMQRVEIRSSKADSHLGHVFDDGPQPTGMRYCINSAALRFVPVDRLEAEGLGRFLPLFGKQPSAPAKSATLETAVLAGGCFWGMEELLRKIPGVLETECGYTGGHVQNPKYDDTHDSKSGHAEAVRVMFDPSKLAYGELLAWFFRMHDPTTKNRQGNDVGTQYRSTIFYADETQKAAAQQALEAAAKKWKRPITTTLEPAATWWRAEDYHQDYLQRNPGGYSCHYLRDF